MFRLFALAALTALTLGQAQAAAADATDLTAGLKSGKVELKSAGPLAFGPKGILFVGDPVAFVVAETLAQAKDAAEAVVVALRRLEDALTAPGARVRTAQQVRMGRRWKAVAVAALDAISAAQRWADGWRGGLLGTCSFDIGFHAPWHREVCQAQQADAMLLVNPSAALVDPVLIDDLVHHAERNEPQEICFTQAAPGKRAELEQALDASGRPRFHARQLYRWIYRRGITDFASMTDLPLKLRDELARRFSVSTPEVVRRETSLDGTVKFLLRLADARLIESVFIPDTPSNTFCVSTQVGCAMRCAFCLTGRMGLDRNLSAGEIAGQVRVLARELGMLERPFNIVLMGMGEPLHNYDNTMKALRILHSEHGLAVSPRRVTLSTVGIVPALERLGREPLMPNLAISLHATTEDQRDMLVPINRKYGLKELLDACRRFPVKRRERITFEYVMLKDVNDSPEDARRLVRLLNGIRGKVNLLPLNEAAFASGADAYRAAAAEGGSAERNGDSAR